jgi:site-specific DNA-methyltransferase (adenine-specific)
MNEKSICDDSVICGDNCEVMRHWPDECVDLVVTSPPYDDLRTYGGHEWDFYGGAWNLARLLKQGGVIVWVVADQTKDGNETGTSMRQALHFQTLGLNLHDTMIWEKGVVAFPEANRYNQKSEFMFVLSKGPVKSFNGIKDHKNVSQGRSVSGMDRADNGFKARTGAGRKCPAHSLRGNVWKMWNQERGTGHPAPFPHKLASDHIQSWSNPGDIVLDPFAGSGTTLNAAKELERRYVGIEVSPEYVEICRRRIAQEVLPLETL